MSLCDIVKLPNCASNNVSVIIFSSNNLCSLVKSRNFIATILPKTSQPSSGTAGRDHAPSEEHLQLRNQNLKSFLSALTGFLKVSVGVDFGRL